ncbi:hypothetical protein CAPTEDRAFT_210986 [Capitella teleta]|uniref:Fibronectin type-III domain-containing protein n=1 Tax=Capitella teleta TaxID=283909 RepID=R7V7U5_CAPTE|nr:hypothetical protein CAPTEDRAFT_210986 [Capitella teleta]|eukprot:ELU14562.1 hypothetical protein CAPTEDRAFT_210986 [Capitella teleta]
MGTNTLRTPRMRPGNAGAPSVPLRPRAFVIYRRRPWSKNISIELEFRWSQPQFLNGIIKSFNLSYTINASSSAQHVNLVGGSKTTYGIFSAHPHSIYTFKVHACTQGHCGQSTEPVSISTSGIIEIRLYFTL